MIMEPFGRDSLGRLIYRGDVFIGLDAEAAWWRRKELTVDLEKSPKRTNYERYFADIGTLDEVIDAAFNGSDVLCEDCPLYRWGELCGFDYEWSGCAGFGRWLEQEATL